MVLGKKGLQLEAWKFAVYLFVPIGASIYFNDPEAQRYWADYFQFLKYPASPNTNLKEQFEELQKKRELEKEQRKAYTDQVLKLQDNARQSRERREKLSLSGEQDNSQRRGWFFKQQIDKQQIDSNNSTGKE
mmetsp:Transcript_7193/g.12906  ORF Transcript_7193/g.12906 Transcript_7193/m.12906 type:complete len:132 (-) Transcript_7193:221-616(-)